LGGAVPAGARQVAVQGGDFYADVLKTTWKNNRMDMLDWGLTAASLAASTTQVLKPVSLGLDVASAAKNLYVFGNEKDATKRSGAAIGAILDLCGVASAGISDTTKPLWLAVKQGAEIPEKALKGFAGALISIFGSKLEPLLNLMTGPAASQLIVAEFVEFSKMSAEQGAEALLQKYIADFVKDKAIDSAVSESSVGALARRGFDLAKDAIVKVAGQGAMKIFEGVLSTGVRGLTRFINAVISDGIRLMLRDLLKQGAAGLA
jgi:hypothetical protein